MKRKDKPLDTARGPLTQKSASTSTRDDERVDLVTGFRLDVIGGPDAPASFDSKRSYALVGTHPSCDLVLADPTVSRFHFEIAATADGRAQLRDLDSTNGTLVDGVSVGLAYLGPGAAIGVGGTQLRLAIADAPVRVPVSTRAQFGRMVGSSSPAMARVFSILERAAASDATVLIEGETGTGKEVAAESIHLESARKNGPFIVVDCGAIPAELLESELFGHDKGAFTGAVAAREGAFEAASGGSLFLDEIGELAIDLQPKILRALERREIKRVGRTKYTAIDVRVIAATNRELRALVNTQQFRSDLYYRLAVIDVRLPPLRERVSDLPALVERLLDGLDASTTARAALRSPGSLTELARHGWPGNVRELRNWLERCLALDERPPLGGAVPVGEPEVALDHPLRQAREAWLRPFERRYVEGLMARHDGNITAAARAAGVDRITFYRLLWRHGMR